MNKYSFYVFLIVFFAGAAFAQYEPLKELTDLTKCIIYVKEKPPKTPKPEDLQLADSVTQYGITWKFDKPARIGQFINGDYYVVGPVTVIDIMPKRLIGREVPSDELDKIEIERARGELIRNGSMLDPPAKREMSYDSGIRNWFNSALVSNVPYSLKPADSLVSTISMKKTEVVKRLLIKGAPVGNPPFKRGEGDNSPIKYLAVLTCVSEPLPPDAFRPSYGDRTGKIYYARDFKREMLPNLAKVPSAPQSLDEWVRIFQRPWVDTGYFAFANPIANMPAYGREVGRAVGCGALMLIQDYKPEEKERLLINYIQVGIDYWGVVKSGHPGWEAFGGHGSGRKINMVIAGILLGDKEMASPTKSFPDVKFQEDMQVIYDDGWTGAKAVYSGHRGSADHKSRRTEISPLDNSYEHLPPKQWAGMRGESYRRCCTSVAWVGQALAIRLLQAENYWNHDAFFDYVDRWMYEDDSKAVQTIKSEKGQDYSANWARQGQAWGDESPADRMVEEMWAKYRKTLKAPTDGWEKTK